MSERSILVICAGEAAAGKIESTLRSGANDNFEWTRMDSLLDGLRTLQERSFDLILADLTLPDGKGVAILRNLQQHAPATPIIVFCCSDERDSAVTAVRSGAFDFFCHEDFDAVSLRKSVEAALVHGIAEAEKQGAAERRRNARFPCRLAVSYQTLEHPIRSGQGTSETLDIGSKGLLFTTNEDFQPGQMLQVSLDWPARLENQVPLKLVAEGRIVRNANGQTAMTIEKYEFRTRRSPARETEALARTRPAAPPAGPITLKGTAGRRP